MFQQAGGTSQSLFPLLAGTTNTPASASFGPTGSFGFDLDGEFSQDSLNTTDISLGRSGHSVRFYPVRDGSGNLIPNTWLMAMDYENGSYDNADFQDNVYLVTNMRPATQAPAVTDLEAFGATSGVSLEWAPVSDSSLIGYNVYRSSSPTGRVLSCLPLSGLTGSLVACSGKRSATPWERPMKGCRPITYSGRSGRLIIW